MNKIKGGHLAPHEVCEFANECKEINNCTGKNVDRKMKFSCGLRRGLLIAGGFDVRYGCIVDEVVEGS